MGEGVGENEYHFVTWNIIQEHFQVLQLQEKHHLVQLPDFLNSLS